MRCPKCHYISYDSTERCRNCGYEFSLSADIADMELPIQTGEEALGPLADFPLDHVAPHVSAAVPSAAEAARHQQARREPANHSGDAQAPSAHKDPDHARRGISAPRDLPLFKDGDAPLVSAAAAPRAPLAVRRATPIARGSSRTSSDVPVLNLEMPETLRSDARGESAPPGGSAAAMTPQGLSGASAGSRLVAAFIDAVILGSIDALVLYFTLKICGLEFAEIVLLPPVPLLAFLLLLDGGYLVAFTTASGQTIGKMAAGIRVVPATEGSDRVPAHHAALRAAAYLVSVLPAGLGLLPALFGADRRAIHDRLADTRVVKA